MSPVRRTKVLRAYELRCQGLTIRQIAAEMNCAPSTVLKYLRDFDAHRAEIIESLAAEQLVRSLQQLDSADGERHDRQIAATREFRLLLESLDRTADRRQRRERRVRENEVHDLEREHQQIYEIVETMLKYGYWDPEEDMSDFFEPVFGPRHNPDAPKPNLPSAPQANPQPIPLPSPEQPPANRAQARRERKQQRAKSAQTRTKTNKAEQDSGQSPAKQGESSKPSSETPKTKPNSTLPRPKRPPNPNERVGPTYPYHRYRNPTGYRTLR